MSENTKKEVSKEVAQSLLEIKAIKLSPATPYTWASGWKSPIYCDNRVSLSFPKVRSMVTKYLSAEIKSRFPDAEVIAGVATAGIPQAALIAQELEKVLPEAVETNELSGIKSVAYGNVVGLLVEAIKELKEEINELF